MTTNWKPASIAPEGIKLLTKIAELNGWKIPESFEQAYKG